MHGGHQWAGWLLHAKHAIYRPCTSPDWPTPRCSGDRCDQPSGSAKGAPKFGCTAAAVKRGAAQTSLCPNAAPPARRAPSIPLRAVALPRFAAAADIALAGREPRLHVAVIAAFGVGDGKQKSLGAAEKAQAQHVGAQERKKTVTDAGEE